MFTITNMLILILILTSLVVTNKPDETVSFFENVLGLKKGDRPAFDDKGAWIFVGDTPQIHLSFVDENENEDEDKRKTDTHPVDHVAFQATNLAEFEERLRKLNVPVQRREFRDLNVTQLNVYDPNGVKIEIQFQELSSN